MSFKTNDFQQITLDDRFHSTSSRTQKMVLDSWAKDFAEIVFPAINEERFSVLYSSNHFSRPNTPVNFTIGAFMLKEMLGLTDDELVNSICCDIRFQYALHTTSCDEQPVSDRTFSRMRERIYNYEMESGVDLLNDEMMHLANVYAEFLNLHSNIKRMDSLMIASSSKRMSRLEIIYTVVSNAIQLMHRLDADALIPSKMVYYLSPEDHNNVIYYCKNEDASSRLDQVVEDAVLLKNIFSSDEWHEFSEYQLLIRVLKEQTSQDEEGATIAKPKKDISPSSLQNPSDPDATYRSKAGKDNKGYVGNIIETVGEDGVSLITDIKYETNNHSDSAFCKEYIESRGEKAEAETMIADGAYGGTENKKLAQGKNVNLITTALTGRQPDRIMADFIFAPDGKAVISCPAGHFPEKTTYYPKTGMCRIILKKDCCSSCPNREKCKAKLQHKTCAVSISEKMVTRAQYLNQLSTEEYLVFTKKRNAVEGIPSVLRRKYHVDNIPVRGLIRSKMFFTLKVGAYNIRKLLKHFPKVRATSAQKLEIA